jgi:type I restriction enzyme S subunit
VALACTVGAGREQIHSHVKTTSGQAGISGRDLKGVTLVVPSIQQQHVLVTAVHERLDAVAELSKSLAVSVRRCGSLRRSLLAAAFSGRLTGRSSDMDVVEALATVGVR